MVPSISDKKIMEWEDRYMPRYTFDRLRENTGRLIAAACADDHAAFRRAWCTWQRLWEIELLLRRPPPSLGVLLEEGDSLL